MTAVGVALAILVGMGWALAGLAALLLLGLLIPLRASGMVKDLAVSESGGANLEPTSWRVQVDWGFGLVRFSSAKEPGSEIGAEWRVLGFTRPLDRGGRRRTKRQARQERAKERRPRWISAREALSLLPELRLCTARLWRSLGLEAKGDLAYGLEDPYLTGLCEGLRAMVPCPEDLRLTPDFGEARLEGWAQVRMTLIPIKPAVVLVGTLFRRSVRRIWWPRLKARFSGTA